MHFLIDFLKGGIVGLANIIPGVSGATMMVAMGIYEQMIEALSHITRNFKQSFSFLFPVLAGAVVFVILFSRLFSWLMTFWPIPVNLLFCGLMLGSIPILMPNIDFKKTNASCWISFGIFFALVIIGTYYSRPMTNYLISMNYSATDIFLLFAIGFAAATSIVVPGVSNSILLGVAGLYEPITEILKALIEGLFHLDWAMISQNFFLAIPFGLGAILGLILIAKVLNFIFAHAKNIAYFGILGLVFASPFGLLMQTNWYTITPLATLFGVCTLFGGALFTVLLSSH